MIIAPSPTLFHPEEAMQLANRLLADPDETWTYVIRRPEGARWAHILIYDEAGEYVGTL